MCAITIYGDGMQTRSFCYVDDLIEGFITPQWRYRDYRSWQSRRVHHQGVSGLTIELTGSQSKQRLYLLAQDPGQRQPSIASASEQLNWRPAIPLSEGLGHTIAHLDRLLPGALGGCSHLTPLHDGIAPSSPCGQ